MVHRNFSTIIKRTYKTFHFQGLTYDNDWQCFDEDQCLQLIQSSLVIQCQTLSIVVQNRICIIHLFNNLYHLQALNVRCQDDLWTKQNQRENRINDQLVEWLRQQLPSTCIIERDNICVHQISLWIR